MAVTYKYYYFACSLRLPVSPVTPHIPEDGNEIFSRIAGETARGTLMFRFSKPEKKTPRAALFVFLRNETRAKSGFVSYVSISLCFDFDPILILIALKYPPNSWIFLYPMSPVQPYKAR